MLCSFFSFIFCPLNFDCELYGCLYFCEPFGAEDEREFDYIEGSEKGPSHWGEIQKDWAACKNGSMQSPIDLSNRRVKVIPQLGELEINYKPCNSTVKNRGHDILVRKHMYGYRLNWGHFLHIPNRPLLCFCSSIPACTVHSDLLKNIKIYEWNNSEIFPFDFLRSSGRG